MSPPHVPKIGVTTVPPAVNTRTGGNGTGAQSRQADAKAALPPPPPVEAGVIVNRSLELLESMAGQVSEATGESVDVARSGQGGDADSSYRVQLMSFIVGSLSRASQAFRQQAAQTRAQPEAEEPEEAEEAVEEDAVVEQAEVEAAQPEQPMAEPVAAAVEPAGAAAAAPPQQAAGYGSKGQAVQDASAEGTVKRWA